MWYTSSIERKWLFLENKKPHVSHNSGNNEWYTPKQYIDAARSVLGSIDLDPASNDTAQETVQAKVYYTAENSGLDKPWFGKVWMNPPYAAALIRQFADKLCDEYSSGSVEEAIVLVNNATETAWFGCLVECASAVVFPSKRIKFHMPDGKTGSPLQGQAFLYLGNNPRKFLTHFCKFGWGAMVRIIV